MTIKTTTDGWDCVPQLREVANLIEDGTNYHIYEINHCVRQSDLRDMVSELRNAYTEALAMLDTIDVDVEYETEWEDDVDV
tara:strand:+ start:215 stop:457 length:243 start_codon:yes stop_codon:yes gene_type:complete